MYPENDDQFEVNEITAVEKNKGGWIITRSEGWSFFVSGDSPVVPTPGMSARFYGKGIGYSVRGLFIDGKKVFYRTEAEDKEHQEISLYGANATEWLRRWDAGETVWSIEMGGLGPGYEQAIQMTVAEILRHLVHKRYDVCAWGDSEAWKRDRDEIEKYGLENKAVKALGLSGAQWGAAMSLAISLFRMGPRAIMTDERVKDRHIQVQRTFPAIAR